MTYEVSGTKRRGPKPGTKQKRKVPRAGECRLLMEVAYRGIWISRVKIGDLVRDGRVVELYRPVHEDLGAPAFRFGGQRYEKAWVRRRMGFLPTHAWKAQQEHRHARLNTPLEKLLEENTREDGTRDGKGIVYEAEVETPEFTRAFAAYRQRVSRYVRARRKAIQSLVKMGFVTKTLTPYKLHRIVGTAYKYNVWVPGKEGVQGACGRRAWVKQEGLRLQTFTSAPVASSPRVPVKGRLVLGFRLTEAGRAMVEALLAKGHREFDPAENRRAWRKEVARTPYLKWMRQRGGEVIEGSVRGKASFDPLAKLRAAQKWRQEAERSIREGFRERLTIRPRRARPTGPLPELKYGQLGLKRATEKEPPTAWLGQHVAKQRAKLTGLSARLVAKRPIKHAA